MDVREESRPMSTVTTYTPLTAAGRAKRMPTVHGSRARYVPNLTPERDTWPVSDHKLVRVEAWAINTGDAAVRQVENELMTLLGLVEHGAFRACDPGIPTDRRPFAWAVVIGDGTYCTHSAERWTRGR
jgi:hypothetical protein